MTPVVTARDLERAAKRYARLGWSVFPLERGGKRPPDGFAGGFHAASRELETVTAWWREHPAANIGLAVPAGIVVLDVDGEEGANALAALERQHGRIPETLTTITGRGGRHHWFRWRQTDILRQVAGLVGPGLDTRLAGKGYVVAPPSVTEGVYRWENPETPIAWLPHWLACKLRRPVPTVRTPLPAAEASITIKSRYGQAALDGEVAAVFAAPAGTRNDTLNRAAFRLGQLTIYDLLTEADVENALLTAAEANGLLADDGLRGVLATIRSGLRAGQRSPRTGGA